MQCPECKKPLVNGTGVVPRGRLFCSNEACNNEETYPDEPPLTNIRCTKCDVTVDRCTCPDFDERFKKIVFHPGSPMAVKWCPKCDKHFARCKCEPPKFVMVVGGEVVPDERVARGFRNASGDLVKVNLYSR